MRISEKKQTDLYDAICDPILRERMQIKGRKPVSALEMDARLYNLQNIIWRRVHAALNLQSIP